uniref:Lysine histidine transporter-like 8 n=1 Tax=Tanacetum cinerariifolium TaxID=118510 RepID=A0A6L2N6L4_TANCI|nr:lysine histidine transporter-like 8 [Tanacetum cinerariifolium]
MRESDDQVVSVPASPKPSSASYLSSPAISAPPSQLQSPSLSRSPLFQTPQHPRTTTKPITRHEKTYSHSPQVFSAPVSQLHSPSMSRSPFLGTPDHPITMPASGARTPLGFIRSRNLTPKFLTPLASPLRKALRLTKLDPHDAWLPITESRNGNALYAAFHTLCSGIGFEALILPVAFTFLGWAWGIILLVCAFLWQFYTLFLLINLHESIETGIRYSRYGQLANAAFGERLGNFLTKFPIVYLSAGTCVALIITGGSTSRVFFQIMCDSSCKADTLTATEWYLVFTCAIVLLSQLPNMNSIAGISLVGAITAVGYCTTIWIASVAEDRLSNVSYDPIKAKSHVSKVFNNFNALGIIVFAFKGHNLILEIQATMPSNEKHPSAIPMWKGVRASYTLIAMCVFPLSIGGFWAYGNLIPSTGILTALLMFHAQDLAKSIKGLVCLLVIINSLASFQIYAMPTFDEMESIYVVRYKKPCPWWLRVVIRGSFGFVCFLFAVAFPFLDAVAGLVGGIALPVTLAYPCFMWLKIKKPQIYSLEWWLNWGLGVYGMGLSVLVVIGGIYSIIDSGVDLKFFKPQ